MPAIVVGATVATAFAILSESALSYLGMGVQPPQASWGNMLMSAQQYVWDMPMLAVYPGALIFLTVMAVNLLGDGIRDAFDPRQ